MTHLPTDPQAALAESQRCLPVCCCNYDSQLLYFLLACLFNTRDLDSKTLLPMVTPGIKMQLVSHCSLAQHSKSATLCASGKQAILCCMQGAGTADVRLQGPNPGTGANVDALAAWKAGEPIDERGHQQHPANLPPSALAGRPIIGQSCI